MKFKSEVTKSVLALELGISTEDLTSEIINNHLEKREEIITRRINFRTSKGYDLESLDVDSVKDFHRRMVGKRFHKPLASYLVRKLVKNCFDDGNIHNTLISIVSLRTHLYIETRYYKDISEECEYRLLFNYSIPLLMGIESKLFKDSNVNLTKKEYELLLRLTDKKVLQSELDLIIPDQVLSESSLEWYDELCKLAKNIKELK